MLPWTIELTLVSLLIGIVLGVPLGVWAALHRNRVDRLRRPRIARCSASRSRRSSSAIILLLLFAIQLPWFPVISARTGSARRWYQSITLPRSISA